MNHSVRGWDKVVPANAKRRRRGETQVWDGESQNVSGWPSQRLSPLCVNKNEITISLNQTLFKPGKCMLRLGKVVECKECEYPSSHVVQTYTCLWLCFILWLCLFSGHKLLHEVIDALIQGQLTVCKTYTKSFLYVCKCWSVLFKKSILGSSYHLNILLQQAAAIRM